MILRSGRLNERIQIQRYSETELPDGNVTKIWTTIHSPYCDVEEKNASIDTIATHDDMSQVVVFTLRWNPEISYLIGDRILWRERVLKIHSFQVNKSRVTTVIIAKTHNETTDMGPAMYQHIVDAMPANEIQPNIVDTTDWNNG